MKYPTSSSILFVVLAPIVTANWDQGPRSNGCTDSCAQYWSDIQWPEGAQGFCKDPKIVASATDCIATASCGDEEKADARASITSLCSEATIGAMPTDAAQWSNWGGDHDSPWTRGGPFGGGWGPWGEDGPWTAMGPWTSWWEGDDCPGSTWSGWTNGPWSTKADWTTWDGCTASTTPAALTTTVDGVEIVTTTYDTQVAQVTGKSDEARPTTTIDTSESGSATNNGVGCQFVALCAVIAGVLGVAVL